MKRAARRQSGAVPLADAVVAGAVGHDGAAQPRRTQERAGQVGLAQHRVAQIGADQVGPGEVGLGEIGPGQIRAGQIRAAQVGAGQRGAGQLGQAETGARQIAALARDGFAGRQRRLDPGQRLGLGGPKRLDNGNDHGDDGQ